MANQMVNGKELKVGNIVKATMSILAGKEYNPPLVFKAKVILPNDNYSNVEKDTVLVKMVNQPKDFPVDFGTLNFRIYTKSIVDVL